MSTKYRIQYQSDGYDDESCPPYGYVIQERAWWSPFWKDSNNGYCRYQTLQEAIVVAGNMIVGKEWIKFISKENIEKKRIQSTITRNEE